MGNMPEIWFPHLGIEIKQLSRVIFQIFGYDVYWYGVIIGSGVLIALALAVQEAKRTQQNPEKLCRYCIIWCDFFCNWCKIILCNIFLEILCQ